MAKVVILGAGVMGSAITIPLTDNNHTVSLVGTHLDMDIIEAIRNNRSHPRLGIQLPKTVAPYTYDQIDKIISDADLIVLGVNSLGITWAAQILSPVLPPHLPIVMVTKGLEGDGYNLKILPDVFREQLPSSYRNQVKLNAIGGPSIAAELAVRHHTAIVIAGTDPTLLTKLKEIFSTSYYHIWTSLDLTGVEVCAAFKNFYTLGVGIATGWLEKAGEVENPAKMHNLAAAIFAQALQEMVYLVEQMGGQWHSVYTLAGAGDFYVTCQSGRNGRMGRLLGLGFRYSAAKTQYMPTDTIEGAELAKVIEPTINMMIKQGKLDGGALPLLQTIIATICHDVPLVIPWHKFFFPPL